VYFQLFRHVARFVYFHREKFRCEREKKNLCYYVSTDDTNFEENPSNQVKK